MSLLGKLLGINEKELKQHPELMPPKMIIFTESGKGGYDRVSARAMIDEIVREFDDLTYLRRKQLKGEKVTLPEPREIYLPQKTTQRGYSTEDIENYYKQYMAKFEELRRIIREDGGI